MEGQAKFNSTLDHVQDCLNIAKGFWAKGESIPEKIQETIFTRLTAFGLIAQNIHEIMAYGFTQYWKESELDLSWLED